ncbi:MAG: hypothetical protein AMXMBFR84_42100 [Candidatus Hydrogenedentota bacterium]
MPSERAERVGAVIKKEIAELLMRGVKDPRVGFVSVMAVQMSPDLKYASVYVSLYGSEAERKGSLVGLQQASGWVRREIGKRIRLRHTPEIRFMEDNTLDQVYRLEERIRELHESEPSGDE